MNDPAVSAFLIAGPSATHCEYITEGISRGKAVFCEKPIGTDIDEVRRCVALIKEKGGLCSLGFNRRYDPSFHTLKKRLNSGEIGTVETVHITSRDPAPPSVEYLKSSGGIFRDMTIHDFDMARWLLGEEPTEIYVAGSTLTDKTLDSFGDSDTAAVILKTASGKLCTILNNRRSGYGYDQRIEVLGSQGMLQADNRTPTSVRFSGKTGIIADQPEYFFLERYKDAYRLEMENFAACIQKNGRPLADETDGMRALILADAATEARRTDDKIIARAQESGKEIGALCDEMIRLHDEDMEIFGVQYPDIAPRATDHIRGMISVIEKLMQKGFAYHSGNDVYFRTQAFADYGCLSGKITDELDAGHRITVSELKQQEHDFVLWKGHKPGEPFWESPWGTADPDGILNVPQCQKPFWERNLIFTEAGAT
ncbi:hypothetical protein CHS0354_002000 [Potamilus streckersoni]|uniref:Inositol 2-dehydrogenase n=1 Tax=Potamilus streckersoni TaxID=2493646 RepID=A0AAE0T5L3_9BIVA|nr:hypothetical protein CHS0354_002000 [Potamilus streckersoni]